ncbi:uncharacterized protein Dvar_19300 [Desulfosarcina variabilis str. Montpellier]|uniref:hypothetical protein n=1 Tax=Desulfosarcina variabilis TaxID=2300 RepID=UPI003AFB7F73
MIQKDHSWTTKNEINFIKGLGTGKFTNGNATVEQQTRAELLVKYIDAAKLRTNWGAVDQEKAISFAEECLRHELNN